MKSGEPGLKNYAPDSHHFGRRVRKVTAGGRAFYLKPRPVYWEWLAFGIDSPLRDTLRLSDEQKSALYYLRVFGDPGQFFGQVEEVRPDARAARPPLSSFHAFGMLSAYAYALGIVDLHRQNTLVSGGVVRTLDVESLFIEPGLPSDSLLFQNVGTKWRDCALSRLLPSLPKAPQGWFEPLVTGYLEWFSALHEGHGGFARALAAAQGLAARTPIRVIPRRTADYADAMRSGRIRRGFCPEETKQMQRGDIPYFFTFPGDARLYWVNGGDGEFRALPANRKFPGTRKSDLHALSAEECANPERLFRRLLPAGLFFLADRFWRGERELRVEARALKLVLRPDFYEVDGPGLRFRGDRRPFDELTLNYQREVTPIE